MNIKSILTKTICSLLVIPFLMIAYYGIQYHYKQVKNDKEKANALQKAKEEVSRNQTYSCSGEEKVIVIAKDKWSKKMELGTNYKVTIYPKDLALTDQRILIRRGNTPKLTGANYFIYDMHKGLDQNKIGWYLRFDIKLPSNSKNDRIEVMVCTEAP